MSKSKSVLPKMSAMSGLARKRSSRPHLGPPQAIFSMDRKNQKNTKNLPIFLGGPMGPLQPLWAVSFSQSMITATSLARCNTLLDAIRYATPAAFAFFRNFPPTSNFGRNFRLLWIFGFFIFFVNFRCFLMILLLNFDVHHSAGHLGWGRKGIALFFQRVAILFPPTVAQGNTKKITKVDDQHLFTPCLTRVS